MKRLCAWLLLLLFCPTAGIRAESATESENPHWMLRPDGEPDEEKCAVCHNEDMDLLASKEETCLSCHDRTLHSGSVEHLDASAEQVAAVLPTPVPDDSQRNFPLAEDGRMYCGTCHLFHDPRVAEETLAPIRPLPSHHLARAVRGSALIRCEESLHGRDTASVSFAARSTGFLRLPIDNDELCVACHRPERLQ